MELKDIYELMEKFDASTAGYLEVKMGGESVKLKKPSCMEQIQVVSAQMPSGNMNNVVQQIENQTTLQQATSEESDTTEYVKAPLVGVFYAAASPDQEPLVKVGTRVNKGDKVCLIEAMKMMSEVKADQDGVIQKILVSDGDTVEYGQPLFQIQE